MNESERRDGPPVALQAPVGLAEIVSMANTKWCLSVRQPWAWLIVHGPKDVENRDWSTKFRGRVLIHAGKTMTRDDYEACRIFVAGFSDIELPAMEDLPRGGIVGATVVTDCVDHLPSPWFCGRFGFVLADSVSLPFVPYNGQLGFFRVEANRQLQRLEAAADEQSAAS